MINNGKNDQTKSIRMMIYEYRVRACLSISTNSSRKVLRGPCSSNHNSKTHQYHWYIQTVELALAVLMQGTATHTDFRGLPWRSRPARYATVCRRFFTNHC